MTDFNINNGSVQPDEDLFIDGAHSLVLAGTFYVRGRLTVSGTLVIV